MKMMKFSKECLYDVEWQALRVSLLSKYNTYGGFGTLSGIRINLHALNKYVENANLLPEPQNALEYTCRVWRVLNLLNATLLGYGNKPEFDEHRELITSTRDFLSKIHRFRWNSLPNGISWDWDKVESDLGKFGIEELSMILDNLNTRVATANRKKKQGTGGMEYRTELSRFITLLKTNLQSRGFNDF